MGTLNSGNQVTAITAAYIRLNTAWVAVATNLVGTPGADGVDGAGVDLSGLLMVKYLWYRVVTWQ